MCESGDPEAVEDSAVAEILGVDRPNLAPLPAPDPGVADLCNRRDLKLCQVAARLLRHSFGRWNSPLIDGGHGSEVIAVRNN